MDTAIKHPVPDRVKPSFVIFDIRALWRSGLSVRVPGCQKLQMTVWLRMLYSCTDMATVGVKWLITGRDHFSGLIDGTPDPTRLLLCGERGRERPRKTIHCAIVKHWSSLLSKRFWKCFAFISSWMMFSHNHFDTDYDCNTWRRSCTWFNRLLRFVLGWRKLNTLKAYV